MPDWRVSKATGMRSTGDGGESGKVSDPLYFLTDGPLQQMHTLCCDSPVGEGDDDVFNKTVRPAAGLTQRRRQTVAFGGRNADPPSGAFLTSTTIVNESSALALREETATMDEFNTSQQSENSELNETRKLDEAQIAQDMLQKFAERLDRVERVKPKTARSSFSRSLALMSIKGGDEDVPVSPRLLELEDRLRQSRNAHSNVSSWMSRVSSKLVIEAPQTVCREPYLPLNAPVRPPPKTSRPFYLK